MASKTTTPATDALTYFTRDQIFKAMQRITKDVLFAPFGGKVRIREISAQTRMDLAELTKREDGSYNDDLWRAWLVRHSVIDPGTLEPLFTDEDVPAIALLHEADVNALAKEIIELSAVGVQALKSVDTETDA